MLDSVDDRAESESERSTVDVRPFAQQQLSGLGRSKACRKVQRRFTEVIVGVGFQCCVFQ